MPKPSPACMHTATVLGSEPIAPDFTVTTLSCPGLAATIKPGQFLNIAVPGDARELLRLPMSYFQADASDGTVGLGYRIVGNGSRRLAALPAGTRTDVLGPGGNGWALPEGGRSLLVGGGSGTVSLVALAKHLASDRMKFDFVEGARTARQVVFERDVRTLGAGDFAVSTDDGTYGSKGFAHEEVRRLLAENDYVSVYVCGPRPMMEAVAAVAREAQVPCQVSLETNMACGFGACAVCAVDTVSGKKGACMKGPVFDAEEVIW